MVSNARKIRNRLGYSRHEAATLAGVGLRTIARIEDGSIGLSLGKVCQVALAYGVSAVDVYPALAARPKRPIHTVRSNVQGKKRQSLKRFAEDAFASREGIHA